MSDEFKACGLCGKEAESAIFPDGVRRARCPSTDCLAHNYYVGIAKWNTRPLEDALQARIDELEEQLRWRPVSEGYLPDYSRKVEIHDRLDGTVMLGRHVGRIPQWVTDDGLYFHGDNYERIDKWRPIPELPMEDKDGN